MDFEKMTVRENSIICSYNNAHKLIKRFPTKMILADAGCPDRFFYYFTPRGVLRHYEAATGMLLDYCVGNWTGSYAITPYRIKPLE